MPVTTPSFAKINLGLCIGSRRDDGFHDLCTVYQTVRLRDEISVRVGRGSGIEIRCADSRVPTDSSNTCYRIAERVMQALQAKGKIVIEITKRLPVQGGLGGASGNAVSAMLALERALGKRLSAGERLRIAAEVGSDLPLFLVGGTVLGVGRGEQVYPLPDLPATPCVIVTPQIAVSTSKAFADWDGARAGVALHKLTLSADSDRIMTFSRVVTAWLSGSSQGIYRSASQLGRSTSGVPARGRGRAETPLLDLVRTGIENDFEQVVFPQYPELREVKCRLQKAGAVFASLSGSGSAVYGLFRTPEAAKKAAAALSKSGVPAHATRTLTRAQYWKALSF
jgi:4-diphosphocytidyl-2-C-methyl-D-erythritol kinase